MGNEISYDPFFSTVYRSPKTAPHSHHVLCHSDTPGNIVIEIMDIVWIITGIFLSAIAIALILGKIHGTLII